MFFRSYLLCQLLIARRLTGRHSILAATASESIRAYLGRGFRSVCLIALTLTRQTSAGSPQNDALSRANFQQCERDHYNSYVAWNRFSFSNIQPIVAEIIAF
jgi:ribose 1,5-bisphosphokinase PhnN